LSEPVALVTGASAGLGATFARRLAARRYNLILVARREDRLAELARGLPIDTRTLAADLATDSGVDLVCQAIRDEPSLELLVNNAGFGTLGRLWQTDMRRQEDMYALHVLAVMRLTRAALEGMTTRAKGAVINVSSIAAFSQSEGNVSYCSTKAWMNSFTEGLDIELRSAGSPVQVQALCPGFTITEFHDVLGIDRKEIPSFLWLPAEKVVDASLEALATRKVIVVPGWQYKITAQVVKRLPWFIRRRAQRPGKDRRV